MVTNIFFDVPQCSLVEINRNFRGDNCHHHQGDKLEAVTTSETSVTFNHITLRITGESPLFLNLFYLLLLS
jgi:hypothetical protein